jgi:hypothetical protein
MAFMRCTAHVRVLLHVISCLSAGKTFGVAKNVTLHAVRVLDCDGTAQLSALLKVCAAA